MTIINVVTADKRRSTYTGPYLLLVDDIDLVVKRGPKLQKTAGVKGKFR